jgi:membrane protein DedA with SNARE-associated domain
MSIESSFIPFPSEIVVPPAAYKAAQGSLNVVGVFCAATAGALIGAVFNYFFAYFLGRKVLYRLADTRIAHFLLITRHTIEKTENYFIKYGRSSTFIGRLIPAIRQLISLPAGFAKMNFKQFLLFTTLGSGLWNIILIVLGYFLYTQKELLEEYYTDLSIFFLVCGAVFFLYMIYKGLKK